jgi:hypothetical protein
MSTTRTTWTVLPQSAAGGKLRVIAMAAPRLEPDGDASTLSQFETWRAWPQTLAGLTFAVDIDGLPARPAARPDGTEPPDPELWHRLFRDELTVHGFAKPPTPGTLVRSYPVIAISEAVRHVYREAARASSTGRPTISLLRQGALEPLVQLARIDDHPEPLPEMLERSVRARQVDLASSAGRLLRSSPKLLARDEQLAPLTLERELSPRAAAFLLARRFLNRPESDQRPPIEPPEFDFHQAISLLGSHPALMRRLGIALDLEFERPDAMPGGGRIRLVTDGLPPISVCPWSRYQLSANRFVPAPSDDGTVRDGMLTLDDDEIFRVERFDVDAAAVKLIEAIQTLRNLPSFRRMLSRLPTPPGARGQGPAPRGRPEQGHGDETDDESNDDDIDDGPDDEVPLPTLRSAGFSIARAERADRLKIRFARNVELDQGIENDQPHDLDADDLVRGYRLDVWDERSATWRSLHRRHVTYSFSDGRPDLELEEEGYVKGTAAVSNRDGDDSELYVHEVLFGWDGWSLSAPRPGRTIGAPGGPGVPERLERPRSEAAHGFSLQTVVRAAPRSLPALRYGRTYRFRARAVDLAAGGLELDAADEAHATTEQRYLRYEPLSAPSIIRRHLDTEGESLERLVIRSDLDSSPEQYAGRADVLQALSGVAHHYAATSERHLAAPKTSQWMAELHGLLDLAFGQAGDPAAGFRISAKESGTFLDPTVVDARTGTESTVDDILLSAATPVDPPDPADRARRVGARGSRLEQGQYLVRTGARLPLPYLPDPLARGFVLTRVTGGDEGERLEVRWSGDWPELPTLRLCVAGGDGPPRVEADRVVIELAPAEVAVIRLSSLLDDDGRDVMGLDELAAERTNDKTAAEWMITPAREMRLVHAVQRPLAPPRLSNLVTQRGVGDTDIDLRAAIHSHAKSTGRVELIANWTDPVDIPGSERVEEVTTSAIPAAFDLQRDDDTITVGGPALPTLDLLARLSPAQRQSFLAERPKPVHRLLSRLLPAAAAIGPVAGKSPGGLPLRRALAAVRAMREARHEFGDTKHRMVSYVARGTTRYREYFPPAISRDPTQITSTGEAVTANVLSSARPAGPVVRHLVPTFAWHCMDDAQTSVHTRRGGGLRVLLERPWYSSGAGELLAVVLLDDPAEEVTATRISGWGSDPVWFAAGPPQPLAAAHLRRAVNPRSDIVLAEAPDGPRVAVAPHLVSFDERRKVWICDIEFDTGPAFLPFVRLALARYQPDSVQGVHLSPVVVCDFVQVLPDRSTTVHLDADRAVATQTTVEVVGQSAHNILGASDDGQQLGDAMHAVVEFQPIDFDGDIGWVPAHDPVALRASPPKQGPRTWTGSLALTKAPRGFRRRLLVTEHEWFPADPGVAEGTIGDQPAASRLVYADAFAI